MHSNVTIKNVSWPHFSWPTLYMGQKATIFKSVWLPYNYDDVGRRSIYRNYQLIIRSKTDIRNGAVNVATHVLKYVESTRKMPINLSQEKSDHLWQFETRVGLYDHADTHLTPVFFGRPCIWIIFFIPQALVYFRPTFHRQCYTNSVQMTWVRLVMALQLQSTWIFACRIAYLWMTCYFVYIWSRSCTMFSFRVLPYPHVHHSSPTTVRA